MAWAFSLAIIAFLIVQAGSVPRAPYIDFFSSMSNGPGLDSLDPAFAETSNSSTTTPIPEELPTYSPDTIKSKPPQREPATESKSQFNLMDINTWDSIPTAFFEPAAPSVNRVNKSGAQTPISFSEAGAEPSLAWDYSNVGMGSGAEMGGGGSQDVFLPLADHSPGSMQADQPFMSSDWSAPPVSKDTAKYKEEPTPKPITVRFSDGESMARAILSGQVKKWEWTYSTTLGAGTSTKDGDRYDKSLTCCQRLPYICGVDGMCVIGIDECQEFCACAANPQMPHCQTVIPEIKRTMAALEKKILAKVAKDLTLTTTTATTTTVTTQRVQYNRKPVVNNFNAEMTDLQDFIRLGEQSAAKASQERYPMESGIATASQGWYPMESKTATASQGRYPIESRTATASQGRYPMESRTATGLQGRYPMESRTITGLQGRYPMESRTITGLQGRYPMESRTATFSQGWYPMESRSTTDAARTPAGDSRFQPLVPQNIGSDRFFQSAPTFQSTENVLKQSSLKQYSVNTKPAIQTTEMSDSKPSQGNTNTRSTTSARKYPQTTATPSPKSVRTLINPSTSNLKTVQSQRTSFGENDLTTRDPITLTQAPTGFEHKQQNPIATGLSPKPIPRTSKLPFTVDPDTVPTAKDTLLSPGSIGRSETRSNTISNGGLDAVPAANNTLLFAAFTNGSKNRSLSNIMSNDDLAGNSNPNSKNKKKSMPAVTYTVKDEDSVTNITGVSTHTVGLNNINTIYSESEINSTENNWHDSSNTPLVNTILNTTKQRVDTSRVDNVNRTDHTHEETVDTHDISESTARNGVIHTEEQKHNTSRNGSSTSRPLSTMIQIQATHKNGTDPLVTKKYHAESTTPSSTSRTTSVGTSTISASTKKASMPVTTRRRIALSSFRIGSNNLVTSTSGNRRSGSNLRWGNRLSTINSLSGNRLSTVNLPGNPLSTVNSLLGNHLSTVIPIRENLLSTVNPILRNRLSKINSTSRNRMSTVNPITANPTTINPILEYLTTLNKTPGNSLITIHSKPESPLAARFIINFKSSTMATAEVSNSSRETAELVLSSNSSGSVVKYQSLKGEPMSSTVISSSTGREIPTTPSSAQTTTLSTSSASEESVTITTGAGNTAVTDLMTTGAGNTAVTDLMTKGAANTSVTDLMTKGAANTSVTDLMTTGAANTSVTNLMTKGAANTSVTDKDAQEYVYQFDANPSDRYGKDAITNYHTEQDTTSQSTPRGIASEEIQLEARTLPTQNPSQQSNITEYPNSKLNETEDSSVAYTRNLTTSSNRKPNDTHELFGKDKDILKYNYTEMVVVNDKDTKLRKDMMNILTNIDTTEASNTTADYEDVFSAITSLPGLTNPPVTQKMHNESGRSHSNVTTTNSKGRTVEDDRGPVATPSGGSEIGHCDDQCQGSGGVCLLGDDLRSHCVVVTGACHQQLCLNGYCVSSDGVPSCECHPGWVGASCDQPCPVDCDDRSFCDGAGDNHIISCSCRWNYTGHGCRNARKIVQQSPDAGSPSDELDTWEVAIVAVATAMVAALMCVASPYILWKKQWLPIRQFCFYFMPFEDDDVKEFDAFVSYQSTPRDERFVLQHLYPKLEKELDFRLCLPTRDFLPGESVSRNTIRAINRSRRTILILSPSYVSEWSKPEYEKAKLEILKIKNKVIPIVLEDFSDLHGSDPAFRSFADTPYSIKWPGEDISRSSSSISKFWKLLELSMPKMRSKSNMSVSSSDIYSSDVALSSCSKTRLSSNYSSIYDEIYTSPSLGGPGFASDNGMNTEKTMQMRKSSISFVRNNSFPDVLWFHQGRTSAVSLTSPQERQSVSSLSDDTGIEINTRSNSITSGIWVNLNRDVDVQERLPRVHTMLGPASGEKF